MRIIKANKPEISVECGICKSILGVEVSDITYDGGTSCISPVQFSAVCPVCVNRFPIKSDMITSQWKKILKR